MLTTDFVAVFLDRMRLTEQSLTEALIKATPDRHDLVRGQILMAREVREAIKKSYEETILQEELPLDA